jgi:uncharacterized membrane protein
VIELGILSRVLHVAVAFWFVGGFVGRGLVMLHARRSRDVQGVATLTELAAAFDRLLVIPGSAAVLLLGLSTAWIQGYPLFGFLQGSHTNWVLASLVLFICIMALGPAVFLPTSRTLDRAVEEARAEGVVTPALSAALKSRKADLALGAEAIVVAVVIVLMVVKPF